MEKLNTIANEIIERYIEDRAEYDIEREQAIEMLKNAVINENIDLNNDTTSYDLEDISEEEYETLQKIIKEKVQNLGGEDNA